MTVPILTNLTSIVPCVVITRTSGMLPLVIQVHAADTTAVFSDSGAAFEAAVGRAFDSYLDLEYTWDFGDSSGTETFTHPVTSTTVNANDDQTGPEAAYVYRTAGTYTVTLSVRGWNGASYTSASTTTVLVNEIHQIQVKGAPTGGTYTLSYGGYTTSAIAFDATPAQVSTALQALTSIGSGNIRNTVYGYSFEFTGTLAGTSLTLMTADGSGLTGGTSPSVAVRLFQPGTSATVATASAWTGSDQYFDSNYDGSNGTSDGTISKPYIAFSALKSWMEGGSTRRALLKRDSSFDSTARLGINISHTNRIEAYGSGADPILESASSEGPLTGQPFYSATFYSYDWVISNVVCIKDIDATASARFYSGSYDDDGSGWYTPLRNIAFLGCTFHGSAMVELGGTTGVLWKVASGLNWTFWNCGFTRDAGTGLDGQALLIGLSSGAAVVGCTFTGGDGNAVLDHYIYPTIWDHSLYRWLNFGLATVLNFCINGNCRKDNNDIYHVILDGCNFYGTENAHDLSNVDNDPSEGQFDEVISQNNAYHVGQIGSQGLGFYSTCLKRAVIRDNLFWGNPQTAISLGDPATHASIYRNKFWESYGDLIYIHTQTSGYIVSNQFESTGNESTGAILNGTPTSTSGWFIDLNQYYAPNMTSGGDVHPFVDDTTARNTFAEWQALGFDTNGSYADPGWTDPANGDFSVAVSESFTTSPSVLLTFAGTGTTWTSGSSVSITDVTGDLTVEAGTWTRTSDTAATLEVSGTGTGTFTVTIDTIVSPTIAVIAGSTPTLKAACMMMGF